MAIRLGIVVPCYNEEEVLTETHRQLGALLSDLERTGEISADSAVYYVDDGSRDRTWSEIVRLSSSDARVRGIKLSRNRGHQVALLAGLHTAEGDALVSIDADLQDDVSVVADMVRRHLAGADVVYGVRRERKTDTAFKRLTATGFYRLLAFFGVEIVYNHADYRLMSRRALEALRDYGEVNLFLRGIVPMIGFKTDQVFYDRAERFAGESKYPLRKMLAFAVDGITSLSVVPLRMITSIGFFFSIASFIAVVWVFYVRFVSRAVVPGWASVVLPVFFLGGVQLIGIGVLGEYIGKIYLEAKRRPRYFIDQLLSSSAHGRSDDSRR
jgi:polyisoprenyl-phosphate glycosyltransferase